MGTAPEKLFSNDIFELCPSLNQYYLLLYLSASRTLPDKLISAVSFQLQSSPNPGL